MLVPFLQCFQAFGQRPVSCIAHVLAQARGELELELLVAAVGVERADQGLQQLGIPRERIQPTALRFDVAVLVHQLDAPGCAFLDGRALSRGRSRYAQRMATFDWLRRHTLPFQIVSAQALADDQGPTESRPRPTRWLAFASTFYPSLWRWLDLCRANPKLANCDHGWPKCIFAPFIATEVFFSCLLLQAWGLPADGKGVPISDLDGMTLAYETPIVSALAAWRATQGIYRFDSDLYHALLDTPLTGDLPCEVLFNLPEWCVYVETPDMGGQRGFFAYLNYTESGQSDPRSNLSLYLLFDVDGSLLQHSLPLTKASLPEIVAGMVECVGEHTTRKAAAEYARDVTGDSGPLTIDPQQELEEVVAIIHPALSLLLYLCAVNAEIGTGAKKPERPRPKKTKDGLRLFPPSKPTTWEVGVRLGAALRHAKSQPPTPQEIDPSPSQNTDALRSSPRAHVRRAHWHTYWSGPRNEPAKRSFQLRWLHPIAVNVGGDQTLVPVIRPVKA